jgi:4-carboxymuconolactone decarboxylase
MSESRLEAGRQIRSEIFGNTSSRPKASEVLAPDLADLVDEAWWGGIWARPGLDLRTKELCTVSALLALERYPYAKTHMQGARNLGVPIEELTSAILQLMFIAGLPVVHNGLALAAEVYEIPGTEAS